MKRKQYKVVKREIQKILDKITNDVWVRIRKTELHMIIFMSYIRNGQRFAERIRSSEYFYEWEPEIELVVINISFIFKHWNKVVWSSL